METNKIKLNGLSASEGWIIACIDNCNFENELEEAKSRERFKYAFNQLCPESQSRVCEMMQLISPEQQNFDSLWIKVSNLIAQSW